MPDRSRHRAARHGLVVALLAAATLAAPASRAAAAETWIDTFAGGLSGRIPVGKLPLDANDVAFDGRGRLFVASGSMVFRLDADGFATRVAGVGTGSASSGDGGPATAAILRSATSIAFDAAGDLYVADATGNQVRKVTPGGTISTLAGTGELGYSGDGGPANAAKLNVPSGLAVDATGNLYVSDHGNSLIRRVTPAGVISTYVGLVPPDTSAATKTPLPGVFVPGPDGTPASATAVSFPTGLAVDASGRLLYVDTVYNAALRPQGLVRMVGTDGRVTTVAGLGSGAAAASIAGAPRDRQYTGDGGPALLAAFSGPSDLAVGPAGTVYVADPASVIPQSDRQPICQLRIRELTGVGSSGSPTGATVTTLAGTGASTGYAGEGGLASAASLAAARGVAVAPNGDVYVADGPHVLKVAAATRRISTVAGADTVPELLGDGLPATSVVFNGLDHLTAAGDDVYFVQRHSQPVVRRVRGGRIDTVAGGGTTAPATGVAAGNASLAGLDAMTADARGNVFVALDKVVWKVSPAGVLTAAVTFATDESIADMALDPAGNLYLAAAQLVFRVAPSGTVTTIAGFKQPDPPAPERPDGGDGGPATDALVRPSSIAVGPLGDVYVGEYGQSRVRRIAPDGTITTVAGTGTAGFSGDGGPGKAAQIRNPTDVTVDRAGQLYIADKSNNRVRRVERSGRISTVAGTGSAGFTADGRPAATSMLESPGSVAALPDGRVLVTSGSTHVRALVPPAISALTLAATPGSVAAGGRVLLSGTLTSGGRPLAGIAVTVSRRAAGASSYAVLARVSTDSRGRYRVYDRPRSGLTYVASYAGSSRVYGATSRKVTVQVSGR